MGANSRYFVKVSKRRYEWLEISALHSGEAEEIAATLPDVIEVVDSQYEKPEEGYTPHAYGAIHP